MIYDPLTSNPLAGNPLESRADIQKALRDLFQPLLPYFSAGGARVRLGAGAAHFDRAAADLEGFARPLWGLAPLAAGGAIFEHWELYRQGLANGTDPDHPEYWGKVHSTDQRMVELAAIGFTLRLLPQLVWDPLPARARQNLAAYLLRARELDYVNNNWKFFRILVDLGLEQVGIELDRSLTERYLEELDGFYLGDGWYRDGPQRRADHYIPFAMHFYGLIYARLQRGDDARAERYRERARLFAQDIRHWYDDEGGVLAFGRSLTYRFACAGFWAALAFADVEALPWGEIKGYFLRHLRWWTKHPIADRDGILSIGYGYPNLMMSESYNSAGSPYWAMKAFLPLALPEGHPFWQAEELPAPAAPEAVPLRHPGMVMFRTTGNVVALSSGQENQQMRFGSEKYAKFAYGSCYGFSIESDERNYGQAVLDNMIGFSGDNRHFRVRESNEEALIAGECLYARWKPWSDVTVETWLIPEAPWHMRVHRVSTPRVLHSTEGGFAIARADFGADRLEEGPGLARARGGHDISLIVDLSEGPKRAGRTHKAPPNTNLIVAKTLVPQLRGSIAAGTTILAAAVLALPAGTSAERAAARPPEAPSLFALEALFKVKGQRVTVFDIESA